MLTQFKGQDLAKIGATCDTVPKAPYISQKRVLMDLIRIILSVIIPPLGVFLQVGLGKHFWLNILLTLLGYIPGLVHAVYIVARK